MARRGFFAELQHQARVAAREKERLNRALEREHQAAVRRAEQARKAEERAQAQFARAAEAERKRFEKEARAAHIAAMEAQVEERNVALAEVYDEIDGLLAATLDVDDHVDLDEFRTVAVHPPFDRADLETPLPPPTTVPRPEEPILRLPRRPSGLGALFGKKRYQQQLAVRKAKYERAMLAWEAELEELPARRQAVAAEWDRLEAQRVEALDEERARYSDECLAREAKAAEQNEAVDKLIANLAYGDADAVQEYVSIVLSNSVYPNHFPVEHDFTFEQKAAELRLRVMIPSPDSMPDIKHYKYTKSADEIATTALSQKARKDRYASAAHQVALRSLHEVFEADRRGIVKTISLEVGAEAVSPATGRETYVPFVAVGAERESFLKIILSDVVPVETLKHLGAAMSKNPFGRAPADTSGIRRS